jgi:7-carboxy-7-deazaguanine synthase
MIKAKISEIFCSIQGEGLYLGQKQIFVRFAHCNLDCDYCDEPKAKENDGFSAQSVDEVMEKIKLLKKKENPEAVSLTGGEPLLQTAFIEKLLPKIQKTGLQIHLETNATLFKEFEKIFETVDVVAADIKLPSSTGEFLWLEHEKFLRLAPKKTFVKIVLTSNSEIAEVQKAFNIINKVFPKMPVFLQPVTETEEIKKPEKDFFEEIKKISLNMKIDYKILPQQHPIWGIK